MPLLTEIERTEKDIDESVHELEKSWTAAIAVRNTLFCKRTWARMDPELAKLLTEVIEKAGLLRRDMQQHGDLEKYEARFARIDQKLSALAEALATTDPALAKALRTAWQLPARSLAFRNAEHKKKP